MRRLPKVSALMPTADRPQMAAAAIECFLAQDYEGDIELVILDTGERPLHADLAVVRHLAVARLLRHIWWVRAGRPTIGRLRNELTAAASGEILIHWDDDDWSAPGRIRDQVSDLLEPAGDVDLVGYQSMLFFDCRPGVEWRSYRYSQGGTGYALGTSLCYRRDWALANPFDETVEHGEDNRLVDRLRRKGRTFSKPAGELMVARIHELNHTSAKDPTSFDRFPLGALPDEFLKCRCF